MADTEIVLDWTPATAVSLDAPLASDYSEFIRREIRGIIRERLETEIPDDGTLSQNRVIDTVEGALPELYQRFISEFRARATETTDQNEQSSTLGDTEVSGNLGRTKSTTRDEVSLATPSVAQPSDVDDLPNFVVNVEGEAPDTTTGSLGFEVEFPFLELLNSGEVWPSFEVPDFHLNAVSSG